MALSRDDLVALMDAFERSEWTEMTLTVDGTRLELTRTGRPPEGAAAHSVAAPRPAPAVAPEPAAAQAPATAPPAAPPPAEAQHDGHFQQVRSPSVGIFYAAPEPGAPPFVEVGRHVAPDDIVCIVEVMKLMNHVKAGVGGTIRSAEVENGTMVEHGQVLFTVEPDE